MSEQSFPVADQEQLVQTQGICWGALDNNRSPDKHQRGWTEQGQRKKHCKDKLGGKEKNASRLPLTEIDPNKPNTPTVVVSSSWVFLLPFKTWDASRGISTGHLPLLGSGMWCAGAGLLPAADRRALAGVRNRSLKYKNYSIENLGTVFMEWGWNWSP